MKLQRVINIAIIVIYCSFMMALSLFVYYHVQWHLPDWFVIPVYIGSLGIFAGFTLGWYASEHVTEKIHELVEFGEVVAKGDLSKRVTMISFVAEIDDLARVMNEMVAKADSLTNTLEAKVAARTTEIETAKKAAEQKASELDRMNKLMVGREMKMIELKERLQTITNK